MGLQCLDNLISNGVEGIQRTGRILKDHRDVLAPDPGKPVFIQREKVLAVEHDLTLEVGDIGIEKLHDRL